MVGQYDVIGTMKSFIINLSKGISYTLVDGCCYSYSIAKYEIVPNIPHKVELFVALCLKSKPLFALFNFDHYWKCVYVLKL